MNETTVVQHGSRALCALFFASVGIHHFTHPQIYLHIMPPYLPYPLALVYISGGAEVAGGIGLLIGPLRRAAGIGLIALLIAVFPANLHMLINDIYLPDMPKIRWLLWARLPVQFAFVFWVFKSAELNFRKS